MSIEGETIELSSIRRVDDNMNISEPSNSSVDKNIQVDGSLISKQGMHY